MQSSSGADMCDLSKAVDESIVADALKALG